MDQLPLAAFSWPIQFCAFSTAATFVVSVITGNVSQVDRLWTFLPTIYTAYFALLPLWPTEQPFPLAPFVPKELHSAADGFSPRATLMLGLIVVWMFRCVSWSTKKNRTHSSADCHTIRGDEDFLTSRMKITDGPFFVLTCPRGFSKSSI